ncbi:MAG: UDP-3-O-(3-hydroxymyristoyl)glucosamine N-acyltransferase [Pirellulaceae bacterium]|nr:UDP-3-O-(3-hydroxymyristoyl)glucosamine N-acyltransferase [Pirellulaceae bacterium]
MSHLATPTIQLAELAELVQGKLHGDPQINVSGIAAILAAGSCDITFAEEEKYLERLKSSKAAAVVVSADMQPEGIAYIAVEDIRQSIAQIASFFRPPDELPGLGVSPAAHVHPGASLGSGVDVHPGAVIGNGVEIGNGCIIHSGVQIRPHCRLAENVIVMPNVVIYENTLIGARTLIHAGAVIGAYGFGYEFVDGHHQRLAQLGYVLIEADVEIGACTTIDRGSYGATLIGQGTKIDNQVMIAHNCQIGRHNVICSQVGIAGSSTTGDYCVLAGQVGVRDHVNIGHRVTLAAKAGVMNNVPDDEVYIGIPATPAKEQKQIVITQMRLPEMRKQLRRLQNEVDKILGQLNQSPQNEAA